MKKITRVLAYGVVFACLITGCRDDDATRPSVDGSGRWVAAEPTQCLTNPWEQDWLARNDNDYDDYPKDLSRPGLEPEEFEIIVEYYAGLGVTVFEGKTRPQRDAVCAACSCPEGYTLYLRVRVQDVPTMIDLGYRVESPYLPKS